MEINKALFNFIDVPVDFTYERDNSLIGRRNILEVQEYLDKYNYELIGISNEWYEHREWGETYFSMFRLLIMQDKNSNQYFCMHIDFATYECMLERWLKITGKERRNWVKKFCEMG